ncbi:conserved hypothetical protein [Ricinus communis]|uniref:Uncharacterized protein n=1 Tax=Ricinus communis TaxID=3988 RepID=B9RKS8_RICCO|nr:conserved hypothetical protein [Ricinus communis]
MCNQVVPLNSHRALAEEQRWLLLRAVQLVTEQAGTETANAAAASAAGSADAGGGGGSIKMCVCSPTRHPGSFRCRHHHVDYAWGRRITKK